MKDAHRFISDYQPSKMITLGIQGDDNIRLDLISRNYLLEKKLDDYHRNYSGSVASFNVNNKSGRFYDLNLGRTVPFKVEKNFCNSDLSPITWSLDQKNRGLPGIITISARRETTTNNTTTKYYIRNCIITTQLPNS